MMRQELQRLVGLQEERAASMSAATAAYQAAATAPAAARPRHAEAAPAMSPPPLLWGEEAVTQLAHDLRWLQHDLDAPPAAGAAWYSSHAGQAGAGRAADSSGTERSRTSAVSGTPSGISVASPSAGGGMPAASSSAPDAAQGALARAETAMARMDARSAEIEGAWAQLHSERRTLERSLDELRSAVGQGEPSAEAAVRDTAERRPTASGGVHASGTGRKVQPGESGSRPRGEAGAATSAGVAPSAAGVATPAPSRRKPVRAERAEDWELDWEREDEEEQLVGMAATALAAELNRLVHVLSPPEEKPARSKREGGGRVAGEAVAGRGAAAGGQAREGGAGGESGDSTAAAGGSASGKAAAGKPSGGGGIGAGAGVGATGANRGGSSVREKGRAPARGRQRGAGGDAISDDDDDFNLEIEDVD